MKHKGFTLVELLVVIVIFAAVAGIIAGAVNGFNNASVDGEPDYSYVAPEVETARAQRRMADEMQRQNELMQRRIELLEQQAAEKK